jgi:hypothetical protein
MPPAASNFTVAISGYTVADGNNTEVLFSYGDLSNTAAPTLAIYKAGNPYADQMEVLSAGQACAIGAWGGSDIFNVFQKSNSGLAYQNNRDGNAPIASGTTTVGTTNTTIGQILSWPSGTDLQSNGTVQQIVILNRAVTLDELNKLAGWESWYNGKNGANLPLNHPYRYRAPYVSDNFANQGPVKQIMNVTAWPDLQTTGNAQVSTIQPLTAVYDVYSLQIAIPNATGETLTGGTLTAKAAVEYPVGSGNIQNITFGGSANGSTAGAMLVSDLMTLTTPIPANVIANIRIYGQSSNSTFATNSTWETASGGATQFGVTTPDVTTGAGCSNSIPNLAWTACIAAGKHNFRAMLATGDSICYGIGESGTNACAPGGGVFVPSLSPYMAVMNCGQQGDSIAGWAANHTYRGALAPWFTHFTTNYGINDGANHTAIIANLAIMASFFATYGKFIPGTITIKGSSSDNFATAVNQSPDSGAPERHLVTLNVRAQPTFFEITIPLEDGDGTGLWRNPGDGSATAPPTGTGTPWVGVHPNSFGYGLVQSYGGVNPALVT